MSIVKSECRESLDEDVESGQCSDDEVQIIKKEKRIKKHKKKDKQRKGRKRKHSNSSSSPRSSTEFFNPYYVNPGKFNLKEECLEMMVEDEQEINNLEITNSDLISETFNGLSAVENETPAGFTESNEISTNGTLVDTNIPPPITPINNFHTEELKKLREYEYRIDISGIDSVTSDLYHYLLDLGLSQALALDLLHVYSKEEEEVIEDRQSNDEDDVYEEEMINDFPIIEQGSHGDQYCGYSPERAVDPMEPLKPQEQPKVAYSTVAQKSVEKRPLIDPLSIPDVGPRDPRLNQSKSLLKMKTGAASKQHESVVEPAVPEVDSNPAMVKEWEDTVTSVVETHLALYLTHNDINQDEYKSILKRAVNKIIMSGEKKLETDKIAKFLHSYVTMMQKGRSINIV